MLKSLNNIIQELHSYKIDYLNFTYARKKLIKLDLETTQPDPWQNSRENLIQKLPKFNQRHIPACVAHTIVTMMQIEWYRVTGEMINFSPRFLDIISWTRDLSVNDGRPPDKIMNLSVEIGCCTEDLLPNDTTLPVDQYRDRRVITKEMYDEASKYRLANLSLIPVNIIG